MTRSDSARQASDEDAQEVLRKLLADGDRTFAEQAGITLKDEPAPLWQLLVLANLLSNRIRSDAAIASARELWKIGCTTPAGTRATTWQQRVDALGRGGYRRYDFSTSTRLHANAELLKSRWDDDLRGVRVAVGEASGSRTESAGPSSSGEDAATRQVLKHLQQFDGIGPAGARIFLREVQGIWPDVGPVVDPLVQRGARKVGLPEDSTELAQLASATGTDLPRVCAALVRIARQR